MRHLNQIVIVGLLAISSSICLSHASAENNGQRVTCQYDQDACTLRDLKEIVSSPYQQGLRLWCGEQVTLKCSFHAFSQAEERELTWIDTSTTAVNEKGKKPCFYAHNVAFFDAHENLIACSGDSALLHRPAGSEPEHRSHRIPVPRGRHRAITQYKSAYYESLTPIQESVANRHSLSDALGMPEPRLAEVPLKINDNQRNLFEDLPSGEFAYSRDGRCAPIKGSLPRIKEQKAKDIAIVLGDDSSSQLKVYLCGSDDKGLEIYYSLKNYSSFHAYHDAYITFFDDQGRLIYCASLRSELGPKAVTPSVTIDDVPQPDAFAVSALLPVLLPRGEYKQISCYKMTMYVRHKSVASSAEHERNDKHESR